MRPNLFEPMAFARLDGRSIVFDFDRYRLL